MRVVFAELAQQQQQQQPDGMTLEQLEQQKQW
jgi:hypothetical protein